MNEENEIQLFPGHSFPSPGMFKPELFGWPCPNHRSLCTSGSLARCVSCHSVQHSCSASLDIMGTGTSLVTNVIWIVCSDPHGHMTKISHSQYLSTLFWFYCIHLFSFYREGIHVRDLTFIFQSLEQLLFSEVEFIKVSKFYIVKLYQPGDLATLKE